jgi:hypothetical protein
MDKKKKLLTQKKKNMLDGQAKSEACCQPKKEGGMRQEWLTRRRKSWTRWARHTNKGCFIILYLGMSFFMGAHITTKLRYATEKIWHYCVLWPTIPTSAVNDKLNMFTHSTFLNMNIKITGGKQHIQQVQWY